MHVALIIERIESWRGGAETSTVQFANHLARLGCEVTVVTTSHVASTPALRVVPIRVGRLWGPARTTVFANRADAYIRDRHLDVVHAITPLISADVYQPRGGTVPEMLRRNRALHPTTAGRSAKWMGQWARPKYRMLADLERKLLERRTPPWVIAISQYVARQLEEYYRFNAGRVRHIFNGVDPDATPADERRAHRREVRQHFGVADDDLLVLCVANNFKLKGVPKVVEALARLRSHGPGALAANPTARPGGGAADGSAAGHTQAIVVGRDRIPPLARLAERLGVASRVHFAGPSQRIATFYHAADMLVHPTYYDPCSRVVLEAMAAGLPVITTTYNGAAERITDGVQGFVIESPRDVAALADRIQQLADGRLRALCGRQAVEAVADVSMARHAERVLALYEEIVRAR